MLFKGSKVELIPELMESARPAPGAVKWGACLISEHISGAWTWNLTQEGEGGKGGSFTHTHEDNVCPSVVQTSPAADLSLFSRISSKVCGTSCVFYYLHYSNATQKYRMKILWEAGIQNSDGVLSQFCRIYIFLSCGPLTCFSNVFTRFEHRFTLCKGVSGYFQHLLSFDMRMML